jgi:hypothetical protein
MTDVNRLTNPQCIHIPDGSVVISGEVFDHFCGLGEAITQLRGNLSLAEDGLASYALEVERIQQAKLTWAMACHCECQACDTFYEAFRANAADPVQDPANARVIAALRASPRPAVETDEAQVSEFVQCWLDSWGERWIPKAYVAAFILRLPPSEMTSTKTHDGAEDRAYYNGARAAAAMAHQSLKAMNKWIDSGCGNRVTALKSEVPVRHRFNHGGEIGKCLKCDQSPGAHPVKP